MCLIQHRTPRQVQMLLLRNLSAVGFLSEIAPKHFTDPLHCLLDINVKKYYI
jgi:hypothetical protein